MKRITLFILTLALTISSLYAQTIFQSSIPDKNATNIALDADIVLTFNNVVENSLANPSNILVHGNQTGTITGTFTGGGTSTINFNPTNNFKPGELITVSITAGLGITNPTVFSFTATVSPINSGKFVVNGQNVISTTASGAISVYAADIDGDGDMDVLSASQNDDKIAWYENDGTGTFGAQQIITTLANGVLSVYAADIDGDGDMDVLSASQFDNKIAWYKNDGTGTFGTQQIISTLVDGAQSVYATDIDGDGDLDVLSASSSDNKIAWYSNNGDGTFGAQQIISSMLGNARSVYVSDLDGDGDLDVISAKSSNNEIVWFSNNGNGTFSTQQIIHTLANSAVSIYALDIDGDGDIDILSASTGNEIAWYENSSFITTRWTGFSSNDWNTVANWTNNIPLSTVNTIIPEVTNAPIISSSTNAATNDLKITEADGLTINSGGTLIVSGTSLGMVTYERDLPTNNWYSIASPVVGQTYNDDFVASNDIAFGTQNTNNRAIGIYNTISDDWTYLQATENGTFNSGQGYAVKRNTPGKLLFKGTIKTDNVTFTPTIGGKGSFNFIGNPYTAYVNSTLFTASNSDNLLQRSIWVWNQQNETYNVIPTNLENFMIAPTQGFFVSGKNTNNLLFSRTNQTTSANTFQKSGNTVVKVDLTDGTNHRYAKVYYVPEATTGFDNGFDGELFGGITNEMSLFTTLLSEDEGKKYQVQAIPNTDFENSVISIGIAAAAGKELTFSVESQNIPEGFNVYLEDKETKTVTQLSNENASYKVLLTSALNGTGRFYLHTKSSNVLNTIDETLDNVSIVKMGNNKLRIVGLNQENVRLKMFNILGKEVFETSFTAVGNNELQLPEIASGIYIVQLTSEKGILNKKIKLD